MSWQDYVDQRLLGEGTLDKAAIYSVAGDSKWCGSPDFEPSLPEIKAIIDSFADKSDVKKIQSEGFYVSGTRYLTLRSDDRSLYGKLGREGVVAVRTKLALLLGHYPEGVQPGAANNTVEKLADYLIKENL